MDDYYWVKYGTSQRHNDHYPPPEPRGLMLPGLAFIQTVSKVRPRAEQLESLWKRALIILLLSSIPGSTFPQSQCKSLAIANTGQCAQVLWHLNPSLCTLFILSRPVAFLPLNETGFAGSHITDPYFFLSSGVLGDPTHLHKIYLPFWGPCWVTISVMPSLINTFFIYVTCPTLFFYPSKPLSPL